MSVSLERIVAQQQFKEDRASEEMVEIGIEVRKSEENTLRDQRGKEGVKRRD